MSDAIMTDLVFSHRWIHRGESNPWPLHSPKISSIDFFLWGVMKSAVYATLVDNAMDFRCGCKTRHCCFGFPTKPCLYERVWRFNVCIVNYSGKLWHLLWHFHKSSSTRAYAISLTNKLFQRISLLCLLVSSICHNTFQWRLWP